jgi:hypothetical protein
VVLQRIILVQIVIRGICCSTKNHTGTNEGSSVYVVLQIIIRVQMEAPVSMCFYKEIDSGDLIFTSMIICRIA